MVVGLVAGLLILGSGGCVLVANRLRQMGWMHCPESPAVVQAGCVYRTGDEQYSYVGIVLYSYRVSSQMYYGTRTQPFLTAQDALDYLEGCAAARMLARYKPENPEESCLFEELGYGGGLRIGVRSQNAYQEIPT
jgi:hypothetical protein